MTVTEKRTPIWSGPERSVRLRERSLPALVSEEVHLELDTREVNSRVSVSVRLLLADGETEVSAATAGTFDLYYRTWNCGAWERFPNSATISAQNRGTFTVSGDIDAIRVVPADVAGNSVAKYELRVTAHRS